MLRETGRGSVETTETVNEVKMPKFKFGKAKDDIDKAIRAFLNCEVAKFGKYIALPNALVYRTAITPEGGGDMEVAQNIIALRIDKPEGPLFIGNSSILPLIGRSMTYGNEHLNRRVADVQTRLAQYIPMIPFSVFTEAGLNLLKIEIIDRGSEETVTRNEVRYDAKTKKDIKTPVEVHFTGASLFKVENKTFMFDIDRREIKHRIFNPFLVELKGNPKTIKEAYESLKPDEVKAAEKAKKEVLRQGEWFFIPVKGDFEPKKARPNRWDKKPYEPLTLRAGNNRPNTVQKYCVDAKGKPLYVTGLVEHSGREHAGLMLKGWYQAIPNTSISSFTVTGDVD